MERSNFLVRSCLHKKARGSTSHPFHPHPLIQSSSPKIRFFHKEWVEREGCTDASFVRPWSQMKARGSIAHPSLCSPTLINTPSSDFIIHHPPELCLSPPTNLQAFDIHVGSGLDQRQCALVSPVQYCHMKRSGSVLQPGVKSYKTEKLRGTPRPHRGVEQVRIRLGRQQRCHDLNALAAASGGEECRTALHVRVCE
jgi:hypothetical protein